MRSLRLLSSGTCSPAFKPQFNQPSRCLRGALKQPSFVCTSTPGSKIGLDVLSFQVNALTQPDAYVRGVCHPIFRGSLNEPSEFLSFGYVCVYGCFLSLGLHTKRSLTIAAGKKGKKADRDVLVKEREDDVDGEDHGSEYEESAKRKKLKAKKKHDDQLDNADATAEHGTTESQLKCKKKKLKEVSQNGDVFLQNFSNEDKGSQLLENQKQEETQGVVNGTARREDWKVQEEKQKDKKKLKSKAKSLEDLSDEGSGVKDGDNRVEMKSKNKRSTQRSQDALDSDAHNVVSVMEGLMEDWKVQEDKQKDKKKLKSKAKSEDLSDGGSAVKDDDIRVEMKSKNKRSTKNSQDALDSDAHDVVSAMEANVNDFAHGETFHEFKETKQLANVVEMELAEELDDLLDDYYFWEDDFELEPEIGDGGEGGGVVLGDSSWGQTVLKLANDVLAEFNGDIAIFAFKVYEESDHIWVRLDKLSDKYGSPTIDEIQQFSSSYSKILERTGEAGIVPKNLAFEVSSPGAERVVQIPQDLQRYKELPMYVRYLETGLGEEAEEKDGIFELESADTKSKCSVWKHANVRINQESIGKGRGLNKKQREWRSRIPFESLRLVRLYIDL